MNYLYMSKKGFEDLKENLEYHKTIKRREISAAIQTAREKGDLSENAEYHAAKEEQALVEKKIVKLEDSFARARIMDTNNRDTSKAIILSKVRVKNLKVNKEFTYQLVSHAEANIADRKISIESPIGKGLLGCKLEEIVEIKVPAGIIKFEILEIFF